MKHPLNILLLLFCFHLSAQDSTDLRPWSTEPITWKDFREQPGYDKYWRKRAKTHWRLRLSLPDSLINADSVQVQVEAIFVRSLSWVRPINNKDNNLLIHEQLHFDIVEWYARKLRSLLGTTKFSRKNYAKQVNRLYRDVLGDLRTFQEEYDLATSGGLDTFVQNEWAGKIVKGIRELSDYRATVISIQLSREK